MTIRHSAPFTLACLVAVAGSLRAEVLDLGGRRELFVDHYPIDQMDGARLKLHEPCPARSLAMISSAWSRGNRERISPRWQDARSACAL
jgi:hypothetical protein